MSEALVLHGARDVRVSPYTLRDGGPDETLLDVAAVGICGSDLHYYKDGGIGSARIRTPFVPGHEFGGYLCEDIPELGLKRGALVAVDPNRSCGRCEWCLAGHRNLCPNVRFIGAPPYEGAMTNQIWIPKSQIVALPESMDALEAAMLEPLGVAIHTVDLAHVRPGASVGVFGCGPIGLLCLQVAKAAGAARLVATDLASRPRRLEAARAIGALAFAAEDAKAIPKATGGHGLDVAIEAAGVQAAVDAAAEAVRPGGRVALAGIPSDERTSFRASTARRKGLTFAMVRRMKHTYPRAIALAAAGRVDLRSIVSQRFPLAEAAQAFETAARREGLKVVVEP